MSPQPWPRIKGILEAALSAPAGERTRVLAEQCGEDNHLRAEVERYLAFEQRSTAALPDFLPEPEPAGPEPSRPTRIGPWRIVGEIGRGGMGVVYLAERDDGAYTRQVAIKVVQPRLRSGGFEDLFRRERQILAQLEHSNIARLLDGGATQDGQLYYVMEYVAGTPLTEYCRKRALGTVDKLHLFARICDAVSYAHRCLVIHRDLKPGNILVTEDGEPHLLDFGGARFLEENDAVSQTQSVLPVLTPLYASPEQVRGERLTTATDIYSLGVVLYELLAERTPFKSDTGNLLELWTAICETRPSPPGVAEDLDAIVMKAIRKDAAGRYSSVDALREDLERYLQGRPVLARQGSRMYRLRRFVVRRRWPLIGAAALLVAACMSVSAIWVEKQRAEYRFEQLRRFARSVVFEIHDAVAELPGSTAARKLIVARSLEYLRSLESASADDVELKWELAQAFRRIGDAQGDASRPNLGDSTGALESYQNSRRLLRQILEARPGELRSVNALAALDGSLSTLVADGGQPAKAAEYRREAAQLWEIAVRREGTQQSRKALARSLWNLADQLTRDRAWVAAEDAWRDTLRAFEGLAANAPGDLDAMRNVALCHKRLAAVLAQRGSLQQAMEQDRAAEAIDRQRVAAKPDDLESKTDLSFGLSDVAMLLSTTGRNHEAVLAYREALELRRAAAAADKNDYRAHTSVARLLVRLAGAYEQEQQWNAGIAAAEEGVAGLQAAVSRNPMDQPARRELCLALFRVASLYSGRAQGGDCARASTILRRAKDASGSLTGNNWSESERERMRQASESVAGCSR